MPVKSAGLSAEKETPGAFRSLEELPGFKQPFFFRKGAGLWRNYLNPIMEMCFLLHSKARRPERDAALYISEYTVKGYSVKPEPSAQQAFQTVL